MTRFIVCRFAFVLCAPAVANAQARRGPAQVATERDVASARVVYREVEQAIAARRLVRRDTTITCTDEWNVDVRRYVDGAGRIRRLEIETGSDDHAETTSYDYDTAGRFRFAFARRGAVNGTGEEERAWFSPAGAVVRRTRRQTHGPGYFFMEIHAFPDARRWARAVCVRKRVKDEPAPSSR